MTRLLPVRWCQAGEMTVAGVDIGGTQCSVNVGKVDHGSFRIAAREQFATRTDRGPEHALGEIERRLERLGRDHDRPSLIGISCGGPLDAEQGIIESPPNLPGWRDIAITARLESALGVPTVLCNDANASALAEWAFGAGRGRADLVYLTFGTGLGAGIIVDGRLYGGVAGLAGEVGHWRLGADAGPEKYGKRGSFEGYCSGSGIATWYRYLEGSSPGEGEVSAQTIASLARKGEPTARRVFDQAAERLGAGVALIADLLAPELVVIGGVFVYANDLLRAGMEESLASEIHPSLAGRCRVVPAELGELVGSYASCCVALAAAIDGDLSESAARDSLHTHGEHQVVSSS